MSTRITVPSVQGRKVRRGDVPLVMVTALAPLTVSVVKSLAFSVVMVSASPVPLLATLSEAVPVLMPAST